MHTYSHSNMVLPTGILKCGSCSAGLWHFQETLVFVVVFPVRSSYSGLVCSFRQHGLFLYWCLSSCISGVPHDGSRCFCTEVSGREDCLEKLGRALCSMAQREDSPVLLLDSFHPWGHEATGGDSEESQWTTCWDRNCSWCLEIIPLQSSRKLSVSSLQPSLSPALKSFVLQIG